MVNGSNTLVKSITLLPNGVEVYSNTEADWSTTIKNLMDYSKPYVKNLGGNELCYPDNTRLPSIANNEHV